MAFIFHIIHKSTCIKFSFDVNDISLKELRSKAGFVNGPWQYNKGGVAFTGQRGGLNIQFHLQKNYSDQQHTTKSI